MKKVTKMIISLLLLLTFLVLSYYVNNIKNKNTISSVENNYQKTIGWWIWIQSTQINKNYWEE